MPTSSSPVYGPGTEVMRSNGRAARFLRTWREDCNYQTLMSVAVSFGCTVLFALYNGYLGVRYGSVWHGGIGIFYLLLMVARGIVLLRLPFTLAGSSAGPTEIFWLRSYERSISLMQ